MRFSVFAAASLVVHASIGAAFFVRVVVLAPPPPPPAQTASLAGDTFDVDEPGDGLDTVEPDPTPTPDPTSAQDPSGLDPNPTPPRHAPRPKSRAASRAIAGAPGNPVPPSVFGAVGERGAVDLPTAFTRAFPQAASTDPIWAKVPFGSAGETDLTLTIDETGKLVSTTISPSAPAPLRAGIARTVSLIRGRTFTAAAGRTRLHVAAHVSPDQVHDGLHGDVFALGGSYASAQGNAFFALAIGRRIDLKITTR